MSDTSGVSAPARFIVSLDQLHLMEAQTGIAVPSEFHTEWGTVSQPRSASGERRMRSAD